MLKIIDFTRNKKKQIGKWCCFLCDLCEFIVKNGLAKHNLLEQINFYAIRTISGRASGVIWSNDDERLG
jgi:hypothetical protein